MDNIISRTKKAGSGGHIVVVGAGFIGLEVVEALSQIGMAVTLIEDRSSVLPLLDPEITHPISTELTIKGVRVLVSNRVIGFHEKNQFVDVELASGERITADTVILSIGVKPDSILAEKSGLAIDNRKAIIVNEFMQTSDENIYAVGDVVTTPYCITPRQTYLPLGGPANRMARIAADHITLGSNNTDPYRGSFGTSIVRVFDCVAGKTGLSENDCIRLNKPYAISSISGPSHASYYPGSNTISLKVTYDPETGKILGGQAVGGRDGVDKRLDVLATALAGNLTINDLSHLDLSYAPPFGSARDVINTVGFLGNNIKSNMITPVYTLSHHDNSILLPIVIDVRDSMSASVHPIPGPENGGCESNRVINIPLESIRDRIEEIRQLSNNRGIITVCNLGKLSYFASRILAAHNIPVKSLQGGLKLLRGQLIDTLSKPEPTQPTNHSNISTTSSPLSSSPSSSKVTSTSVEELDVCGIACPGPIMAIRKSLPNIPPGGQLKVIASDSGFYNDFKSFCRLNNLNIISLTKTDGKVIGQFEVPGGNIDISQTIASNNVTPQSNDNLLQSNSKDMSLVVFSGELDKVLAAFVLANGAIAMGGKVTMFFTFWGLNALRTQHDNHQHKDNDHMNHSNLQLMDKMLRLMLPSNADSLPLSNLQMGGLGPIAMKLQMKQKHLPNLPDLMNDAIKGGVRIVACTMSMSALGILESDLIENVELGGVADFLDASSRSKTTLFI
eukprot:CAMPEP_0174823736 /NCGR_PEP_ID=MMETSP1107-20130205/27244_1 /TAXON_ID=36770 /ORGANISM="Paraphysomonas vestita, Strain GFlagA" /LENGTH=730 /DNA_ID=CAMNT_0016047531 /DNA_START=552 /DNA_END=2744 /DNA_ORIENTATION=-